MFDRVLGGELNAGIDFLEFRPSEVAAAVAISVSGEIQALDIDTVMSSFILIEKVILVVPTDIKLKTGQSFQQHLFAF